MPPSDYLQFVVAISQIIGGIGQIVLVIAVIVWLIRHW